MYIHHLILLPVLLAALPAIFHKLRRRKFLDAAMLSGILATVLANGLAMARIFDNQQLGFGLYMLQASLSCMIVPSCYAYFSHVLGRKLLSGTTLATLALTLLMLAPDICIVNTLSNARLPGSYDFIVPHSLNIISGGRNVFHMTIEGCVIILQAVIVLRRIIILDMQMHRYELSYTASTRIFIAWAISCAVFAVIYQAMPARTWAGSAGAWLDFGIYVLLGAAGFLGIAFDMRIGTAVVTREGAEAVHLDRFIEGNRDLARRMRELFENSDICLRQGLVIDDVAEQLGTNRTYFTRMMRAEFGMSFTEYIQRERVEYCKKRLLETNDSLEEIAFDSGLGSASNLSRVFKKITCKTPDCYRKQQNS